MEVVEVSKEFSNFEECKKYFIESYTNNSEDIPDKDGLREYIKELNGAQSVEELCAILNKGTEEFGDGSRYYIDNAHR